MINPLRHINYSVGNTDIREDMDQVDIPYPTPENFTETTLFSTDFDYINYRYLTPTWVTATPDEMEEYRWRPTGQMEPTSQPSLSIEARGGKGKWIEVYVDDRGQ